MEHAAHFSNLTKKALNPFVSVRYQTTCIATRHTSVDYLAGVLFALCGFTKKCNNKKLFLKQLNNVQLEARHNQI